MKMRNPHIIEKEGNWETVLYCPGVDLGMTSYDYCEECNEQNLRELKQAEAEDGAKCIVHGVEHEFLDGDWVVDSHVCGVCEQIDMGIDTLLNDYAYRDGFFLCTFEWDESWIADEAQEINDAITELICQQAKQIDELEEFKRNALDLRELPEPSRKREEDSGELKYHDTEHYQAELLWNTFSYDVVVGKSKNSGELAVGISDQDKTEYFVAADQLAVALLAASKQVEK